EHHDQYRDDDGGNHHRNVLHQANSGDDRIQREDDVDYRDLQDYAHEPGLDRTARGGLILDFPLDAVPDLHGALEQQEQTAEEQNQVATRNTHLENREQIFGETHDPGNRQQQQNPRAHRQSQAEETRLGLLLFGQAA